MTARRKARAPLDTTPAAHAAQIEVYRRMGGRERSAAAFRLNELVRGVAMAGIRSRHPEYSQRDVQLALWRMLLGDSLARRVWGRLVEP